MSYVSKVRIGLTEEGLNFLKDYVKNKLGKEAYLDSYMKSYQTYAQKDNILFIGWDWVNFNEKIPDVKAIYEALNAMKEKEIPYRMGVIGEDYAEYGAIEIVDMDPFEIIPQMYTTIDFEYDFNTPISVLYNDRLRVIGEKIFVYNESLKNSINFENNLDEFKKAYNKCPELFSDEILITLHSYITQKGEKLIEAKKIVIFDGKHDEKDDINIVANYIRQMLNA